MVDKNYVDKNCVTMPVTVNVDVLEDVMKRLAWCERRIEKLNMVLRNTVEYFGMQYTGEEDEFYAGDEDRKL